MSAFVKIPGILIRLAGMPLASKAYRANTPEVRVLKAKLAHAISSNRLCPNRKHLIARQPYAPEYPWDGEMKGPFVHVGKEKFFDFYRFC